MTVKVTGIQLSECWWGNYFAWPYRIALKRGLGCRERGGGGGGGRTWDYVIWVMPLSNMEWIVGGASRYRIVENFREFVKIRFFVEKTLADWSLLSRQRTPCPKISWRKLSQNRETRESFFPRKFPAIRYYAAILSGKKLIQWSSLQVHIVTEADR